MYKRTFKSFFSTLLISLLLSILFALCFELKNDLQLIKVKNIKNQTKKINIIKQKHQNNADINNFDIRKPLNQNMQQSSKDNWVAIERKDSYNNELQFYSKNNVFIKGNTIEIISKKETKENKMYTSGLVESTSAYKYGYFEFIIEFSQGKGIFPAIWFLPDNGSILPEIDLFEMIGSEPYTFYGVIHYKENNIRTRDYFSYKVPIKKQYSVALEWKLSSLTWYIDNQKIYSTTKGVPQEYMYIIINQAIGGNWPGNPDDNSIFPCKFKIISAYIEPVFKKGRD
ncbi:glycoside hydrolase family 16 protein [Caloranaerobacter ferrireducens]|uniref:glycoside hydrolase family 16 protein n=1 Tax=Caloranaerobacter ferrireducens TaxID=1323370 RepID=UPI00084DE70E|nr:glycoside hydrolase family 16 protein [Caloranaerobacter ferrireducens]